MLGNIGPTELIVILLIILLLFGAKRIPEIAQGLGRGIREFKKASKDIQNEITNTNQEKQDKEEKKPV